MVVAWRRFATLLARAEHFGEAATCPQCKAWGKFKVLAQERRTLTIRLKRGARIG